MPRKHVTCPRCPPFSPVSPLYLPPHSPGPARVVLDICRGEIPRSESEFCAGAAERRAALARAGTMFAVVDARFAVGVVAGAGVGALLYALLRRPSLDLAESDGLLLGQLINRSGLQRRHAFHADVVDDGEGGGSSEEADSDDGAAPGGGNAVARGKKKKAKRGREGGQRDWQEKEDSLINLLFNLMRDSDLKDACEHAEHLIYDHLAGVHSAELARLAPELVDPPESSRTVRRLHSALPLSEAFRKYDRMTHISSRKKVPPQFREVRNIVNLAQVIASASAGLKLITFDGDGTLYPDRSVLDDEGAEASENGPAELIDCLLRLLDRGVTVALCTAVGDPSPEPFRKRLQGLLRRLAQRPEEQRDVRLFAVGGQCNYVFKFNPRSAQLEAMERRLWEPEAMGQWTAEAIRGVLDAAEAALIVTANQLGMAKDVRLVRKERAVGLLYTGKYHRTTAYFLDELALKARDAVKRVQKRAAQYLPFCTFNGGRDVFVDVGTKELGIDLLRRLVKASRAETLHVGDQFSRTGNDLLARKAAGTLWVDDETETCVLLKGLLESMDDTNYLRPSRSKVLGQ